MSRNLWAFSNSLRTRPGHGHEEYHISCRYDPPSNQRWVILSLFDSDTNRLTFLANDCVCACVLSLENTCKQFSFFFCLFCLIVETFLFLGPPLRILRISASLSFDSFVLHLFFHSAMCARTYVFLCVGLYAVGLRNNSKQWEFSFLFLFLRIWNKKRESEKQWTYYRVTINWWANERVSLHQLCRWPSWIDARWVFLSSSFLIAVWRNRNGKEAHGSLCLSNQKR